MAFRGEVRLKLFAEDLSSLAKGKIVFVGGERRSGSRRSGRDKCAIARFEGVSDRSSAEALRGTLVEIDRAALPPLAEGEYYHADLIGLVCVDEAGGSLGHVVAVENFGAGDLLEIESEDGKRALIPFRDGIADLADGRVVVDPDFLA